MSVPPPIPVKRSMLVTVVAWIFIGLSTFATLVLLMESLLLPEFVLPMLHRQVGGAAAAAFSPAAQWLFEHAVELCHGLLLVAVLHLIAAIGLLRRAEWGRRLMLAMLGLDVLYQLAVAAAQYWVVGPMQHALLRMPFGPGSVGLSPVALSPSMQAAQAAQLAQMLPMMDSMMAVGRILGIIAAAAFIIVFGWLITRLCSPSIRREFTRPSGVA